MNAIHVNWTLPARLRSDKPYEVEDFELLTTILSALKWREHNGKIRMITDSVGLEYYEKINIASIWNEISVTLDEVDVNPHTFWAGGKLFALQNENAPVAIIDTDFIVWNKLDFENTDNLCVIHREQINADCYPTIDYFQNSPSWLRKLDWNVNPCNTAFCVFKNDELLKLYTEKSIEFMRSTSEFDDKLTYMLFAEQRLLAMLSQKLGLTINSFSSIDRLFDNNINKNFTHTWGMKQQMRSDKSLRDNFCRKCVNRIVTDFPHIEHIIRKIDCLNNFF